MLAVALASLAVTGLTVLAALRLISRDRREHDRREQVWESERGRLIDQLLHANGKTWTPPPVRVERRETELLSAEQLAEAEIARAW